MRRATFLLLLIALGSVGWAGELARPVLFSDEPVTIAGKSTPVLEFCGESFPVNWVSHADRGRTIWSGKLPPSAPLGVWTVKSGRKCFSFLRIPAEWAILRIEGGQRAKIEAPGLTVLEIQGLVYVIGKPGDWRLHYVFPGDRGHSLSLSLAPHERRNLLLASIKLELSTPVALPGFDILVKATVLSPIDIPSLKGALRLPQGWTANPVSCETCPLGTEEPIPAGTRVTRAWRVHVPKSAVSGSYEIAIGLPEVGTGDRVPLEISGQLPPEVVVSHWDVSKNTLDLTLPPEISYDQLCWAAGLLGQEIPYSHTIMTQEILDRLANLWEKGASSAP